jgi:hypothetical protein
MRGLGFAFGFLGCWLALDAVRLPLLWYLPLEHRWELTASAGGVAMGLYGRLLWASCAGAVMSVAAMLLERRAGPRALAVGTTAVLALLTACCISLFAELRGAGW